MPLSEHEQRQLEQIEQALYAEHPRFAKAVRSADPQVHYRRRLVYAGLGFVIGVALLVVGVATKKIWIGILGFGVMLAACYWFYHSYRRMNGIASGRIPIKEPRGRGAKQRGKSGRGKAGGKRSGGLGNRLDERWRRRQDDDGR